MEQLDVSVFHSNFHAFKVANSSSQSLFHNEFTIKLECFNINYFISKF